MTGPELLDDLSNSFDRSSLTDAPADVREFARVMSPGPQTDCDRRRWRRYALVAKVVAVPLDDALRPSGPPFVAYSRNVSFETMAHNIVAGGLSLIYNRPAPSACLFVEFESHGGRTVRAVLKVLRSRGLGPYFEIVGEFISPEPAKKESSEDSRQPSTAQSSRIRASTAARFRLALRRRPSVPTKETSKVQTTDAGERAAKRDVDLVRQILLVLEARRVATLGEPMPPQVDGWDTYAVERHFVLMAEANLIETVRVPCGNVQRTHAVRLKWDGHEFLDQCRTQAVWDKSKRIALESTGGLSVAVLKEVLKKVATESIA